MARLAISRETLQALFAKSGNICAFPGCNQELVTNRNLFVGQICHIEAANPGGQRFNPSSTDEDRRSFSNLMLLCYRHHRETDDVEAFNTLDLRRMKLQHESNFGQKPFKVNEAFLHRLESEMAAYWSDLAVNNQSAHVVQDFAVPIHTGIPATDQFLEIYKSFDRVLELLGEFAKSDEALNEEIKKFFGSLGYDLTRYNSVPYYDNPFFNRNWEYHALAVTNTCTDLSVVLKQAEVRFLEEYLKTHSNDLLALDRLGVTKEKLNKMAVSAGYAD